MWNFLYRLLFPQIDDEFVPEEPEDSLEEETPEEDPEELPEEEPEEEPEPAPRQQTRAQKEITTLRERAQKAEEQHRTAMAELELARRQPEKAQPTHEQTMREQEDAILRNPESTDWQRYAVQSARDARMANTNSQAAIREARDLADRSAFERIASTKPKTHAAYKDKVEDLLKKIRSNGNDAPREELLAILVGRDMLAGKLKSTEKSVSKTGGAKRGTTPGARSDVSSSGGGRLSEAEKRAKRLENVRI